MEYMFAEDLEEVGRRGRRLAGYMREDTSGLVDLLNYAPDTPFAGCALVDSGHAQDGSVAIDSFRLCRVAVGKEGADGTRLIHWIQTAAPHLMLDALRATMRGEEIDHLDSATTEQLRDWYDNAIPWMEMIYCEFRNL